MFSSALALTVIAAGALPAESPPASLAEDVEAIDHARRLLSPEEQLEYDDRSLKIDPLSPGLFARLPALESPGPIEGESWALTSKEQQVSSEKVAAVLGRTAEVERFPHRTGPGLLIAGLTTFGISSLTTAGLGIASAAMGNKEGPAEAAGVVAFIGGGVGLVLTIVGWVAHGSSDRMVPLELGADLARDYNSSVANWLVTKRSPTPGADIGKAPLADSEPRATVVADDAPEVPSLSPSAQESVVPTSGFSAMDSDGVRIISIEVGGPAEQRLQIGDVILSIDGIPVPDIDVMNRYLARCRRGDRLAFRVRRRGTPTEATLTLGGTAVRAPRPAPAPAAWHATPLDASPSRAAGLTLKKLETSSELSIDAPANEAVDEVPSLSEPSPFVLSAVHPKVTGWSLGIADYLLLPAFDARVLAPLGPNWSLEADVFTLGLANVVKIGLRTTAFGDEGLSLAFHFGVMGALDFSPIGQMILNSERNPEWLAVEPSVGATLSVGGRRAQLSLALRGGFGFGAIGNSDLLAVPMFEPSLGVEFGVARGLNMIIVAEATVVPLLTRRAETVGVAPRLVVGLAF